eukprot:6213745-Pleurochrysis_carterae.AAC.9
MLQAHSRTLGYATAERRRAVRQLKRGRQQAGPSLFMRGIRCALPKPGAKPARASSGAVKVETTLVHLRTQRDKQT